jgi:hypothetical protein
MQQILPALEGSMERMWNSEATPGGLDRLAMETEVGISRIKMGHVHGLDRKVYQCTSDDTSVSRVFRPVNEQVRPPPPPFHPPPHPPPRSGT